MSQEERDRRLGLTGLGPTERTQRIAELEDELDRKQAAAMERLDRKRRAQDLGEVEQPEREN